MKDNANRNSRGRKTLSAVLAVAMVGTMLLSGTLAYFYRSGVVNTIFGTKTEKEVYAHDDFVKVETTADGKVKYNKDVYVENTGAEPVLIRVRLSEDFTLDGEPVTKNAEGNLQQVVHIPDVLTEGNTVNVGIGTAEQDTATAGSDDIHRYFTWEMGNLTDEDAGIIVDTSRKNYLSAKAPAYTDTAETALKFGEASATGQMIAQDSSNAVYQAGASFVKSLGTSKVITMQEYMDMTPGARNGFSGWVIDNSAAVTGEGGAVTTEKGDGWIYWSQMLLPNQTTGLLLNGVTVSKDLAGRDYTYNIHVDVEVVDRTDEGLWLAEDHTTAENLPGQTIEAEKVYTEGAKTLLDTAKEKGMSAGEITQAAAILTAMESATSESAKKVYAQALSKVGDSDESQFSQARVAKLIGIAEGIEKRVAAGGDPYLEKTILKTNSKGELDTTPEEGNPYKITSMNPTVMTVIMDEYDVNGDHVLTGEEALSVTAIDILSYGENIFDTTGVAPSLSNLTAVSKENFENLLVLWLWGRFEDASLNEENLILYADEGKTKVKASVEELRLFERAGNCSLGTIDLGKLVDLNVLQLSGVNGTCKVIGLENLTGMSMIELSNLRSKFSGAQIQSFLTKNSTLETFVLGYTDVYGTSDDGITPTEEVIKDYSTLDLDFSGLTNLREVKFYSNSTNGPDEGIIDLRKCVNLQEVSAQSAKAEDVALKVWVKDATALKKSKEFGNAKIITGPALSE